MVTAQDVVYGVKRACDPRTASDYAYILYVIQGCQELNSADPEADNFQELYDTMGVTAPDDATVEFTLNFGAGFFPQVTTMSTAYPVPQWVIEDPNIGERWIEPGFIVTNGAYVMEEWVHGDHLTLKKNPQWPLWGTDYAPGNIERVFGVMIEEASTAFALYENNELDTAGVPQEQIDRVKQVMPDQFVNSPINCSYYYGFVTTKAPVDDVRVRRALSMAIDRKTLVEAVTKGGQIPANTFANPLNFGAPAEDPDIAPWALTEEQGGTGYDQALTMGKELLDAAGYPDGAGLDITLMHNVSEGHARIAQAVQAFWQEAYPQMTVTIETQEWTVYLDTIGADAPIEDAPHVFRLGWCADYPHENNWVHEVFNPEEGANRTRLSTDDPQVGDLIQQFSETTVAAQTAPPDEQVELYKQAEKLLIEDIAAIAPIYYYTTVNVTKPWLERSYDPIKLHAFQWTLDWDAKQASMR
jgi:oligopeptide transport system substrate-binding protein